MTVGSRSPRACTRASRACASRATRLRDLQVAGGGPGDQVGKQRVVELPPPDCEIGRRSRGRMAAAAVTGGA